MSEVIIQRCPVCPIIGDRTRQIVDALAKDLEVNARVEDGAKGELSVLVDGVPLLKRDGDSLPSMEEVEAVVMNTMPAGV